MDIKKQALSGAFWTFLQTFGTQFITFGVSIILSRLLLPSDFGLIAMLGVFIALGGAFINSGLSQSLIRTLEADEEDYATVFYFNLVVSIFTYCLIYMCAPFIASFYNQEQLQLIIRVYSVTFVINAFSTIQITRLSKMLDFKTQMLVSIPSLIFSSIVGVIMAFHGYGVWSLVWSAIVQSLASTIQFWYHCKWRPLWLFNIEKFKYHFHFGMKLLFSGILDILFTNAYTIIIGRFFAASQVGFYNRANSLQMLPASTLSAIVANVSFPLFASIQNDEVRLKSVYKKIMQMVIFLVAPTLIFMAVLAEPLFRFLFTEKWLPAVPYFQILCINGILYPIHSYNLQILNVKGRSDLFLKLEIIKKIIAVIAIGISFQFGIYGLLYGSVLSSILAFFINTHYSGKFLRYSAWEQTKDLLPTIGLSIFIGGVVYICDIFWAVNSLNDFSRITFGSLIGALLFLSFSYLFKINSLTELIHIIKRK
ncbi:lipopolysaccharide biosynthesis protein [Flavobacterium sp. GP15]|uniref:lipopolysaccharide biosynthesis protein n=1 Tax=Flavobacterium sp. GP15 TaxID=2758567 RepID=UPI00165D979F|nr:lipopolysaccharide biosynthesis protein [Flavobacterium sp. GP15]